jgi:hypothetical protein
VSEYPGPSWVQLARRARGSRHRLEDLGTDLLSQRGVRHLLRLRGRWRAWHFRARACPPNPGRVHLSGRSADGVDARRAATRSYDRGPGEDAHGHRTQLQECRQSADGQHRKPPDDRPPPYCSRQNASPRVPSWANRVPPGTHGADPPSTNRSLPVLEPVCECRKRKLKKGDQRRAAETYRLGAGSSPFVRLETWLTGPNLRKCRGSYTASPETILAGWGGRIRTSAWRSQNPILVVRYQAPTTL